MRNKTDSLNGHLVFPFSDVIDDRMLKQPLQVELGPILLISFSRNLHTDEFGQI
jgi:hypothetical protein